MLANSSSNASLPPPPLSSFISLHYLLTHCFRTRTGTWTVTTFTIANILLIIPLCILVLYTGLRQWRGQRSGTQMSHSDHFTYHMVITELMNLMGLSLICCGVFTDLPQLMMVGVHLFFLNLSSQICFHPLTCMERYLAVVHPITYRTLRKEKGIRNIIIGLVWLLSFAGISFLYADAFSTICFYFGLQVLFIIVVSYCSLCILCVLIRPGPGEGGGGRQRVDQSKLRALYTIMAILGVLLLRFGGDVIVPAVSNSPHLGRAEKCGVFLSAVWFRLPSSLVLPLLYLHRAGRLPCCKNNKQ